MAPRTALSQLIKLNLHGPVMTAGDEIILICSLFWLCSNKLTFPAMLNFPLFRNAVACVRSWFIKHYQ